MSDENAELHESKPEVEQKQNVDLEALTKRLDSLEASKKRIEDESRSWKAKYQNVKSEREQEETESLQANNDFKGLYEKALEEKAQLVQDATTSKKAALETKLKYEVAKNAKDAADMDILMAAIKVKKSGLLGYDQESGQWKGVSEAIEELRVENTGLFETNKPGFANGRPQAIVSKEKSLEEQLSEDPTSVLDKAVKDLLTF